MPFRVRHVLAASILLAACGGRYSQIEGEGSGSGGTSTGNGGGSGQGGKKPGATAGSPSSAGTLNVGGKGSAGTASTSGGKAGCICNDQDCPPGYLQQPDPNGCCNVCVPLDCRMVPCPGIACAPGSQLIYPPDQCCPVCGPNDCEEQRQAYFELRGQLLARYNALGCMVDEDCTLMYEGNACASSCGTPIPWIYEKEAVVSLHSYASKLCASCPMLPVPPCEPSLPPACVEGRCQIRPFR